MAASFSFFIGILDIAYKGAVSNKKFKVDGLLVDSCISCERCLVVSLYHCLLFRLLRVEGREKHDVN